MEDQNARPVEGTEPSSKSKVSSKRADEIMQVACKMLLEGAQARAPRFEQIRKNEDMYNGVQGPALRGRSNIPFDQVVMGGYIDTLMAGVQEDVGLKFSPTREQDKMSADKITGVWDIESGPGKGAWEDKIMDTKFLASLSGRGFNKLYFENTPKFKTDFLVCDHYDMITEALGGGDIDKHIYKFQMNIFRTKNELLSTADEGYYDRKQVQQLIFRAQDTQYIKSTADAYNFKATRFAAFGIDANQRNFAGQPMYNMTEGVVNLDGEWYYILFSFELKTWVRCEMLEDVFAHAKEFPGRGPWVSWATNPHAFIFWSKAPADDIRPIAYTMKKVVNLTVDNLEKRNWDMKAYDPKIFREPSQLLYRQDGIAKATLKNGQNIQDGIYSFQTPDTTSITINLVSWLDNFLGTKTGINNESQGTSSSDRVGITVANGAAASRRLMLHNARFERALVALGTMFDFGCFEYIREDYAVKILGPRGALWDEYVTRKDTERDFVCTIRSKTKDAQRSLEENNRKELGFQALEKNPTILQKINPVWLVSERLRFMGYNEEDIRIATDTTEEGDPYTLAEAAQAISDCMEGKELYRFYRNANGGFIKKILDFCDDNFPLYPPEAIAKMSRAEQGRYSKLIIKHDKLLAYAFKHLPIVQKNMERKAVGVIASMAANTAQNMQNSALARRQPVPQAVPGMGAPSPYQQAPAAAPVAPAAPNATPV